MNLLQIYKKSLFIRYFEEKIEVLFKKGLINGTAHACIGQEYIPVIISQYLTDDDIVTSTHRGHGHALAKGLDPTKFLAELCGKELGYNYGRGGSQHVTSKKFNFYANGISGGMVPIATGMAFANKYKKNKNVVVSYMGDGGFNEGYVGEALNIAATWKLPVLFVCENNQYAMSTHVSKTYATPICQRVGGFGIICESIEDNNYEKLDTLAKKFIHKIRETQTPYFLEVQTYRHKGHSKNDKNLYRSKNEEEIWFGNDVLLQLEGKMISKGEVSQKQLDQIKTDTEAELENIMQKVVDMPSSDVKRIWEFLYAK